MTRLFCFVLVGNAFVTVTAQAPTDADLNAASGGRTIRVRVHGRATGMPVELYVARVLAGEGEPRAAETAQQALAIAIRTYAAANMNRHERDGFDLCDTTHCQVLRPTTPLSRRAALATAGQVLFHGDRPADVWYSASCGGRSEAASQVWAGAADHPYLRSTEDDVCEGDVPWTVELSVRRIHQALRKAGFEGRRLRDIDIAERSQSGRVARLRLPGLQPDEIAGDDFRLAIGPRELRSTAFTVTKAGDAYRFVGRGYGHGVGLCVIGAGRRAARGESVAEILDRYYPGLTLGRVDISLARISTAPVTPRRESMVVTRVPQGISSMEVERLFLQARDALSETLGITPRTVTIDMHESLDSFRHATGRPWWITVVADRQTIVLAPVAALREREALERSITIGVAEWLLSETFSDRPAWMRVGGARYFARSPHERRAGEAASVRCPADAELTMSVSAAAQREAETRAEACFAHALAKVGDWRKVR